MKKLQSLFLIVLILSFSQCAKKGRPSGGPKDEDAPLFVTADPPYESINFNRDEIRIYFNEYIKLKELSKQLIISPPLKPENPSLITPQGSPSKYISIKILDTLLANTTYIFDFGNSVEDNNESNTLERFKYVFSTGSYIDSLELAGNVKNSFKSEKIEDIKLLLYRLDSSYTDSAVYKRKPDYVTSSLDSSFYQFSNLRKGTYNLIALKDSRSDYIFDPRTDEIGFLNETVSLPLDTFVDVNIPLFKEILPFNFKRGKEDRKGKLIFSYDGKPDDLKLEILSEVPENFKSVSFYEKDKDTLNFWHSPIKKDSLIFKITEKNKIDTITIKLRKKELDSLTVTELTRRTLEYKDTLFYATNNPILKIDTTKIDLSIADTIKIPFIPFVSKKENKIGIIFEKKLKSTYKIKLFPNAFSDIFNTTHDTINGQFRTKSLEDYGDITLNIINPNLIPVIIQLIDNNGESESQQLVNDNKSIIFKYLTPKEYTIRIIYDINNNGKWDTGNFLKKIQPEKVEYFPEIQKVRANWSLNSNITIKQ